MIIPNGHLVLIGTTASGKSSLSIEVAKKRPILEIISMDSMAIYQGMNIGTATPSDEEQSEIKHHLINKNHLKEMKLNLHLHVKNIQALPAIQYIHAIYNIIRANHNRA